MSTVSYFVTIRRYTYAIVGVCACIVLGLAAHFASIFLPKFHRPYVVFSLVVSSLTIVTFLVISQRSRPIIDMVILFILDVLWLTMGAWSTDVIGNVQCFGQTGTQPTKDGTISNQSYCQQMKTLEAFSWATFIILTIALITLIILIQRLTSAGQFDSRNTGFHEMPWFGQPMYGGGYGGYGGGGGYPQQQQMMFQGNGQQPYVIQQAPGHSVVIQPQPNGYPMVQQVPGTVA